MANKLDKNQRVRSNKPRNPFDLSHDYIFTATTGQLRPVTHDLVQAGDKVKGTFNFFVRSMPLSTAAMIDVDFIVDYFFVPLELLWLRFGAWWSQTKSFPFNWDISRSPLTGVDDLPKVSLTYLKNFALFGSNINTTITPGHIRSDAFQNLRLLEDLGFAGAMFNTGAGYNTIAIDRFQDFHPVLRLVDSPNIFPWQLLAYNCIYQHYYRNEEREEFSPRNYNVDKYDSSDIWQDVSTDFVKMYYVNRQDDYFTSNKMSPLVSGINNNPNGIGSFDIDLGFNDFHNLTPIDMDEEYPRTGSRSYVNLENDGISDAFSDSTQSRAINQLRALFAQEKLLHMMNMTNKDYDSQVLARLGYNVPTDVKHSIMHLGHDTTTLGIQEIVSGSNTFDGDKGSALGDLAGQGKAISKGFKGFDFVAPTHGVVMTIFTCRTRPKYTTSILRKDLVTDITDFFTPELDDLGMQPLYECETNLANYYIEASDIDHTAVDNPWTIRGWTYRYEQLKRNIDRASVAFMRASDGINYWVNDTPIVVPSYDFGFNSFTQWTYARQPFDRSIERTSDAQVQIKYVDDFYSQPNVGNYKVQPNELNNIMLVDWLERPASTPESDPGEPEFVENWERYPWLIFQRDPFIVDSHFDCRKVSAMSLYSMPKLV